MAEKFNLQSVANVLKDCIQDSFEKMCRVSFSEEPELISKDIIEYESRMRLYGLDKFNGPCYITVINIYADKRASEKKDSCGMLALFIKDEIAPEIVKAIGNKGIDNDNSEIILDSLGTLFVTIVNKLQSEMRSLGYREFIISEPIKYKNDVPEGADFPYIEKKYFEINFFVKKAKAIVVNVTIAPLPSAL